MRILVYGVGAVGGYLGARLMQAGNEVVLVARENAAQLISTHGLTIAFGSDPLQRRRQTVQPTVTLTLRQAMAKWPDYDLVILAMKSYSVKRALDELVAFYPEPPLLLAIQNGIGTEELLSEQFGAEHVMAGAVTVPLSLEARNIVVEERTGRGLALAPVVKGTSVKAWASLFNAAGIDTVTVKDYRSMKWSKALLNMVGNATAAILNRHPQLVYEQEVMFDLEVEMLEEALAVMRQQKIKPVDLPGSSVKRLIFGLRRVPRSVLRPIMTRLVAEGRGGKLPSFQLDLNAGKKQNEVLFHNGVVANVGRELGVPTPVNRVLTTILMNMVQGKVPRDAFSGNPRALVEAVRQYKRRQLQTGQLSDMSQLEGDDEQR